MAHNCQQEILDILVEMVDLTPALCPEIDERRFQHYASQMLSERRKVALWGHPLDIRLDAMSDDEVLDRAVHALASSSLEQALSLLMPNEAGKIHRENCPIASAS